MQIRNGAEIAVMPNATNRRFSFYLNRPSEFTCEISLAAPEATRDNLTPGTRELIAYRNGAALETVFALTRVDVKADATEQRLELGFEGIATYLADALVLAKSNAYTGTTLAWDWIETFQARTGANYGFAEGIYTGTPPTRTRVIEQDASVLDEIIALSESGDGFDFNVGVDRAWNEWHTSRGNDLGVVLEYGVNVQSFDYEESTAAGEIVTDVRAYGPPNSGPPRVAADATARTLYGRREASVQFMSESENATVTSGQLQKFADASLDRSSPLVIPQVQLVKNHPSIEWDSYWLGDTVTFRAKLASYAEIDQPYRIIGIHVDVDENDNESITLDLNTI